MKKQTKEHFFRNQSQNSVSVLSTTIQHMFANKSAPPETTKKKETTIYYLFYKKRNLFIGAHLKTIKYCVKCIKKLSLCIVPFKIATRNFFC